MRKVAGLVMTLALLWCGWWYIASTGGKKAALTWFEQRRAAGWDIQDLNITRSGFPKTLDYRARNAEVHVPTVGLRTSADFLTVRASALWPGNLFGGSGSTRIQLEAPNGPISLKTDVTSFALMLHPGFSLELERVWMRNNGWQVSGPNGSYMRGFEATFDMTQSHQNPETYLVSLTAPDIDPGLALQPATAYRPTTPGELNAEVTLTFGAPLDRTALDSNLPQLRNVTVEEFKAQWGDMIYSVAGTIAVDPHGMPDGKLDLRFDNWRQALVIAESLRALDRSSKVQAETMLSVLSSRGGDPDNLNMTLTFKDGSMAMGPIPLGPAPRLILR